MMANPNSEYDMLRLGMRWVYLMREKENWVKENIRFPTEWLKRCKRGDKKT